MTRGTAQAPDTDHATDVELVSNTELLASALIEALDAYTAGVLGGPGLDEIALGNAWRRAVREDSVRAAGSRSALLSGAA